jgi:condensin complex subunit 2
MASTHPAASPRRSPPPAAHSRANARRLSSFHTAKKPARHTPLTPHRRAPLTPARRATLNATPHASAYTPGRRKAAPPVAPDAAAHAALPPVRMSDAELADMYSTTIKLCQDNKINAKNTWSLNLIDYMDMLVKDGDSTAAAAREDAGADTNFQIAGVTLDAGVRIYCSRVDSVHSNAFKVLGALSRTSKPGGSADGEGGDVGEDDDDEEMARGKQKRKRGAHRSGGSTLEANLEAITVHKLETDLAVDPLFQQMSAAFDEGGAKGMLLNNLAVGPRCEIVFDSSEPAQLRSEVIEQHASGDIAEEPDEAAAVAVYSVTNILPPEHAENDDGVPALTLCPRFMAFYRSRMAASGSDGTSIAAATLDDNGSLSTAAFGNNDSFSTAAAGNDGNEDFGFEYNETDLRVGDGMGMLTSVADSMHEDNSGFAADFDDEDDVGVFNGRDSARLSLGGGRMFMSGAVDLIEAGMALHSDSEYSFFDASALSSWAGPQHWRFRAAAAVVSSTMERDAGLDASKQQKKPRGKTAMLLDYSSEAPDIDFAAEFARPKNPASCQLSDAVQDSFTEKKVTLPDDLHFKTQSLATLFMKPKFVVVAKRRRTEDTTTQGAPGEGEDKAARGWYDFENDGDNDNFCPADDDIDDANALFVFDEDADNASKSADLLSSDLVPEPTRVEKIDIGFATVAKKVDVRQLKSGMWTQLRAGAADDETPEEQDGGSAAAIAQREQFRQSLPNGAADDVRAGGKQTLQQVVGNMASFVPQASLPDVSLSYVFICLLHLANEKKLSIEATGDGSLNDLIISSSPDPSSSPQSH